MKNKIGLLHIIFSFTLLSVSSCTIDGEEICGIWHSNGNYGSMEIEITPWKGKFIGYLLSYKNGSEIITGAKKEEFIFISDLILKDDVYEDGKIYMDPSSDAFCGLILQFINNNEIKAKYNCDGQMSEEIWRRSKSADQNKPISKVVNPVDDPIEKPSEASQQSKQPRKANQKHIKTKSSQANPVKPNVSKNTKNKAAFHIIGLQTVVDYNDDKAINASTESLWKKMYDSNFSSQLTHIIEPYNAYVSYSNYDEQKGKMSITLGYKVKDISQVPANLKGVFIPANSYLVYPINSDKSNDDNEAWEQLGELMMQRKSSSVDFEVYSFDDEYNVKKAELWMAAN